MQISYYTLLLGTIYCFQLSNFTPLSCEAFIGQEFFSARRELGMSTRLAFRDTATNHRPPAFPRMTTPRLDRHLYHYTFEYLLDFGFLRIISLALRLAGQRQRLCSRRCHSRRTGYTLLYTKNVRDNLSWLLVPDPVFLTRI